MIITTHSIRVHGLEQWISVVRNGEQAVVHLVKRWSESAARSEAMRWASAHT